MRVVHISLLRKSDFTLAMQTPLLLTNLIHTLGRALQKPSITLQNCREKSGGFEDLKNLWKHGPMTPFQSPLGSLEIFAYTSKGSGSNHTHSTSHIHIYAHFKKSFVVSELKENLNWLHRDTKSPQTICLNWEYMSSTMFLYWNWLCYSMLEKNICLTFCSCLCNADLQPQWIILKGWCLNTYYSTAELKVKVQVLQFQTIDQW